MIDMAPCKFCEHPSDAHKTGPYAPINTAVCQVPFCQCQVPYREPVAKPGPIHTRPIYSLDGQRIIRWEPE